MLLCIHSKALTAYAMEPCLSCTDMLAGQSHDNDKDTLNALLAILQTL